MGGLNLDIIGVEAAVKDFCCRRRLMSYVLLSRTMEHVQNRLLLQATQQSRFVAQDSEFYIIQTYEVRKL